jgi:rSAM/selenodomain-associated transferase 1
MEFQALAGRNWSVQLQAAGDLGRRMSSFFASALLRGDGPVVLIGSDSPTLPTDYVEQAFDLLDEVPVVLGPSTDGGYYLIGASGQIPCVFTGISWSTSRVCQQTISLLRQAGCRFASLPQWYDVDDMVGLVGLRDELAAMTQSDDEFRELQQRIDDALNTG